MNNWLTMAWTPSSADGWLSELISTLSCHHVTRGAGRPGRIKLGKRRKEGNDKEGEDEYFMSQVRWCKFRGGHHPAAEEWSGLLRGGEFVIWCGWWWKIKATFCTNKSRTAACHLEMCQEGVHQGSSVSGGFNSTFSLAIN